MMPIPLFTLVEENMENHCSCYELKNVVSSHEYWRNDGIFRDKHKDRTTSKLIVWQGFTSLSTLFLTPTPPKDIMLLKVQNISSKGPAYQNLQPFLEELLERMPLIKMLNLYQNLIAIHVNFWHMEWAWIQFDGPTYDI